MTRKAILIGLFGLLAAAFLVGGLHAQTPRTPVQVDTGNTGTAYDPAIYADHGRVYIAWSDSRTGGNGVYFAFSTDNGRTFSTPVRIDSDSTDARKDLVGNSVIADGANVYLWWYDRRDAGGGSNDNIWFAASHDGGNSFGADQRIDDTGTPGQFDVGRAYMAASGMNVYFALMVNDVGGTTQEGAYVNASADGGATFSGAVFAGHGNPGDYDVDAVGVACFGQKAFIAFNDTYNGNDDLFGVPFDNLGNLGALVRIDTDTTGAGDVNYDPSVAMTSAANIHVAWQEKRTSTSAEELRYNNSIDGGLTFGTDQLIGGYTAGTDDVDNQWLAASGQNVILAWEDNRTGSDEVYLAASDDGGATWGADVTCSSGGGGYPRAVADGDGAAVAWTGPAYPEEAWVIWSRDGGATWGSAVDMSMSAGDADYVELSVDATYNSCHVAYLDDVLGQNNLYTNSFRSAAVSLTGQPMQGSPVSFHLDGAMAGESGAGDLFRVVASWSLGSIPLPDGRVVDLRYDSLFKTSLKVSGLLTGAMNADGTADTPTFNLPLASGSTFYVVGAVKLSGGGFGSITDPLGITVQ